MGLPSFLPKQVMRVSVLCCPVSGHCGAQACARQGLSSRPCCGQGGNGGRVAWCGENEDKTHMGVPSCFQRSTMTIWGCFPLEIAVGSWFLPPERQA